jgi:hypothetical protein
LSQAEKGIKLNNDENVTNTMAADILQMGHRNLDRARAAIEEGREPGKNGRPSHGEEITNFIEQLKALPADCRITYKELRNQVKIEISLLGIARC